MNFTAVESGGSGARGKHCMYVAYFMVNELPVFCIHTQTNKHNIPVRGARPLSCGAEGLKCYSRALFLKQNMEKEVFGKRIVSLRGLLPFLLLRNYIISRAIWVMPPANEVVMPPVYVALK